MLAHINTPSEVTPIKKTHQSPGGREKSSVNKEKIMDMILNTDGNNKVSFYASKTQRDPPISILKNRVCPRQPSFPDKCLNGYENLKESSVINPRQLATTMNNTCQFLLDNSLYLKRKVPSIDWNKSVKGKDFHQRTETWVYEKEQKIDYLRHMLSQKETKDCTFSPVTHSNSPTRRSSR